MNAEELKKLLKLEPLPEEGGFYAETYRSEESVAAKCLPERYGGERRFGTAIYFLLTPENCSLMHRLASDEVYHFYLGDAVELLVLREDGSGETVVMGADLERGMRPQVAVPRGAWQGSRLRAGGEFALLGTTVAPGFEFADRELGSRAALAAKYPRFAELIRALTR